MANAQIELSAGYSNMKIICAGYYKTGTKSLASALRYLGYDVYDYDGQMALVDKFSKLFDGTITDDEIRDALKDIDVLIDGGTVAFWEEFSRVFPEAKVILTTRDDGSWWESFKGMQEKMPLVHKFGFFLIMLSPTGWKFVRLMMNMGSFIIGVEGPFAIPLISFNKKNSRLYKYKFRQHNSHVLNTVPKDKLLVLPVGSGWEPLCQFLGLDVPDIPYPHKNKKGAHFTTEGGPQSPVLTRIQMEIAITLSVLCCIFCCVAYFVFVR